MIDDVIEQIRPLAERIYLQGLRCNEITKSVTDPTDAWCAALHFFKAQEEFKQSREDELANIEEQLLREELNHA